jgi:hypothetical protein
VESQAGDSQPAKPGSTRRWDRPLGIAAAIVFMISTAFPVAAALTPDTSSLPPIVGILDVAVAFLLVVMAFTVITAARGQVTKEVESLTYRLYRILIHAIFALIVIFFLFGDRIHWINGLLGVGWRFWLLLYALPSWLALMGLRRGEN